MRPLSLLGFVSLLVLVLTTLYSCEEKPIRPELPFETSNYTRTSTYQEVIDVVTYLAYQMPNAYIDTLGYTNDGKILPLVILSDQKITNPQQAHALERPLIFVMANIHGGEVEGKDAMMKLLLEFADGKHRDLLSKLTIMIAPIYNADGNDDFDRLNRITQNGPDSVGVRTNRQGFDLNRDYMKLASPEARALIGRAFNYWDPILFMDLHTTNGSYHGYHLTYSTPLNPNTHPQIVSFQDRVMMPVIKEKMTKKDWRIYEYGNFVRNNPDSGWATFSPQPRFGTNYYGLRNRLTLLSESYSYVDFKSRIISTYDFVMSTLQVSADQAQQLNELRRLMDVAYSDYTGSPSDSLGTAFTFAEPVEELFLMGSVDTLFHKDINRMTFKMRPEVQERTIKNFRAFSPTRYEKVPFAYYIDNSDGRMDSVLIKLREHGINPEEVREVPDSLETFLVTEVIKAPRPFQDRILNTVNGSWMSVSSPSIPLFRVTTNNTKRNLIFYLLEPTTDDGLVSWTFANPRLSNGQSIGIYRQLKK
jgi:hypothetical protein